MANKYVSMLKNYYMEMFLIQKWMARLILPANWSARTPEGEKKQRITA